ncbi:MAG TPA: glycosyltransferase family 39 protein [Acidobacteriaceae bacterium]|jgi:4-amino-4-deoxy-L-arabinose transferase-like glycosyltransferase
MNTVTSLPAEDSSIAVPPAVGSTLRQALLLAGLFALLKFALHLGTNLWETHIGWGYFRDEMYYILCGQHLDWGYVDHGPIVALQARAAVALFGNSLAGIRIFSTLAGAATVFLTGMIGWAIGGRLIAQALAMLGMLLAPEFLGLDSFLSMNSFEAVFWMAAVFAILMLLRAASGRQFVTGWWIVFGLAGGLGIENKPSMVVFLVALLIGLLLTPERRIVFSRGALVGVALVVLLALPNLLWQIHHHYPTLEFIHNGKVEHKNVDLSMLQFLGAQVMMLSPFSVFLWLAGVVWLLVSRRSREWRFLGWTYLVFLALMFATRDAKDYYLAPIYPAIFAAGGLCWEALLKRRSTAWIVPTYAALLIITGILIMPISIPVLTPQQWLDYTARMHLRHTAANMENEATSAFPQFYADRFGWQEMVDQVTRIYNGLSPADRARVGILCSNYGEASAINFLGRGLPFAISGHNNYWIWGPHGYSGDLMIVINGASLNEMHKYYDSVEIAGVMDNPYAMPFEHRNIYLCRGRKGSIVKDWPEFKHYI